jgi:cell division protein FtsI (penicillin-binding protein 3)
MNAPKTSGKTRVLPTQKPKTQAKASPKAWRRWLLFVFLMLGTAGVLARAVYLQVLYPEDLVQRAQKKHTSTVKLLGQRGGIFDRNGEALARSAPVATLWIDPSEVLKNEANLPRIAKEIGLSTSEFRQFVRARKGRKSVDVLKQISPARSDAIMALKIKGLYSRREYRRYYPTGRTSAQVVGFANAEQDGQEGIEYAFDKTLSGKTGSRNVIRSRDGRIVEDTGQETPAQAGTDIRLTLDQRLQYLATRELKKAVDDNNAKGGLMVIADVKNGDILAIASLPDFDPNQPLTEKDAQNRTVRSRALADLFEPGSTIKPLLVASALEEGLYRADSSVNAGLGPLPITANYQVKEHDGYYGTISLGKMLAKSSNVGSAVIGLKMGAERIHDHYQRFGLGAKMGTGFPGEGTPLLRPAKRWRKIDVATASFGYGFAVTGLHLIRAYAALGNDGLMPVLRLVIDGEPAPPTRVVSAKVARDMRELMRGAITLEGTASRAAVPGYSVTGKTGTIRKLNNGQYADNQHQSAFIGLLPAKDTRLVGLVVIDEPRNGDYYGGLVAAPVFAAVMTEAARLLQIPQDQPLPVAATVPVPVGSTAGMVGRP